MQTGRLKLNTSLNESSNSMLLENESNNIYQTIQQYPYRLYALLFSLWETGQVFTRDDVILVLRAGLTNLVNQYATIWHGMG